MTAEFGEQDIAKFGERYRIAADCESQQSNPAISTAVAIARPGRAERVN